MSGPANALEAFGWPVIRDPKGTLVDQGPRCWRCNKKIAHYIGRPWSIECGRCHAINNNPREEDEILTPSLQTATVTETESG